MHQRKFLLREIEEINERNVAQDKWNAMEYHRNWIQYDKSYDEKDS